MLTLGFVFIPKQTRSDNQEMLQSPITEETTDEQWYQVEEILERIQTRNHKGKQIYN